MDMKERRRRCFLLATSAVLIASLASRVDGFIQPNANSVRKINQYEQRQYYRQSVFFVDSTPYYYSTPILAATPVNKSSSTEGKRRESPFGVRRRVRAVLEKAKTRTGIRNTSTEKVQPPTPNNPLPRRSLTVTRQSASSVIADTASIGGLGAVVVDKNGTIDVALDLKRRTDTTNNPDIINSPSVKDPASTSSPVVKTRRMPEDDLVLADSVKVVPQKNGITAPSVRNGRAKSKSPEVEAIRSDVPAAYAEPLPFTLPRLSQDKKQRLLAGERIQEQSKMGREGSGYVVMDVKAPPYVVWECLLDFESYPQTIPTVRNVKFFSSNKLNSGYNAEKPIDPSTGRELRHYGTPSTTRAAFCLSKFRLNIAAIHNYRPHPDGDYMVFTLDPECTNMVLKNAKGIWHTQRNPDGRGEDWVRVWLLCEVGVSSMLPSFIVDYAARRAMPRATTWLKPQVEAAAKLWLKNSPPSDR